ncbi:Cyclopentanol dehydrogenase [bioreactor metagenome]|uniref:Cyclopentanol dehydrogenase n=1 Tax=bioreactor metagenome TaxID=1076179 RepID=A0A644V7M4_9ZZZZ|nr:SDR family NAD(P)-dependent oxidoreductase [Candidatus Elulimicrobiales bacterium]
MSKIEEKIILISGGTDGLGLATAKKLSKDHTVIILSPSKDKCENAVKYEGVNDYVLADITKENQIEKAVKDVIKRYGRIDILINNAGIWIEGPLEKNDSNQIKKVLEVNSLGTILLTQKVLPHMKKAGSGRIINIVSQAGLIPKADRSVYRASKYAVRGFTESLIPEVAPDNISICGFYPDKMNTNFFKKGGEKVDTKDFIDVSEAVKCLEFLVNTSPDLNIPIFGLKKLNQY